MKELTLSKEEILQFQYILPVQGDLKSLELVESITIKARIENNDMEKVVSFDENEIKLMHDSIAFLNSQKKIYFQSLPLIKKILNI